MTNQTLSRRKQAALLSLGIGIGLLAIKFAAFYLTGSQAIFSDAVESIVNVLGACVSLWAIHGAEQPADANHPYGHGKIEYFSAAFEGSLIGIAGIYLVIESIRTMLNPVPLGQLDLGLALVALAGLVNLSLGLFLLKRGKKDDSAALVGSGHHLLSDFWTSVGVLGGLFLVQLTGWQILDGLIGCLIGLHLVHASYKILKDALDRLADRTDDQLLEDLGSAFDTLIPEGVIQLHNLKILKSGRFHHIDVHAIVPEFWTITQGHDYMKVFEERVLDYLGRDGEFAFHIDPCRRSYCSLCSLENCKIREDAFRERFPFSKVDSFTAEHPEEVRSG